MFETALIVDKYYTPLLFLFGTLGNSLSLLVFCMNAKYRSQSASYYLSALAISDTGFLVNLLAVWLETVHGGVITSGLMCPLVMYLGQVTCFMSVYLTVAFSIERYVAVHYPLSRPRICTRSKARKAIAALTAIALLVFSYAWVIARVIEPPLKSDQYGEQYQDIFTTTNFTEDSPEGALPFPGESREKDFIFSSHPASAQFLTSNDLGTRNKDAFQQGENCGNGNYLMPNNSLNLRQQIESLNCSRMHLNEMTSRDSRKLH
ncbi:Cholecystokinin receptor [Orchesella cincta]|uniref:Cholecystokinin receptor n=1 Tax=Orchesella cincta TaxID=48709 RepID=A0A1D2N8P8_ORCCI|nr:Cholecystokinin receptor [Orchesella cincta]